jgi:hypothetical protein
VRTPEEILADFQAEHGEAKGAAINELLDSHKRLYRSWRDRQGEEPDEVAYKAVSLHWLDRLGVALDWVKRQKESSLVRRAPRQNANLAWRKTRHKWKGEPEDYL